MQRLKGIANGTAVLALWRGFAWTRMGSPKKNFRLTAEAILDGEARLRETLLTCGTE